MTFECLSDFFLSWAAYAWKDNSKGLKIQIFPDFLGGKIKPKTSPQADCNEVNSSLFSAVNLQGPKHTLLLLRWEYFLHRSCSNGCLLSHIQISAPLDIYWNLRPSYTKHGSEESFFPAKVKKTHMGWQQKAATNWTPLIIPCEERLRCSKRSMRCNWFQPH